MSFPGDFKQQLPPKGSDPLPQAAALALINAEGEILLVRRVPAHGGDWVYPGGAVDLNETFKNAARRETIEETGVTLDPGIHELFPLTSYITAPDAFGVKHDLLVFVSRHDTAEPRLTSPNEVVEFGWFHPEEAIARAASGTMKITPSGIFAIQRAHEYLSDEHEREYGEVLMGGTFDRLHQGHQRLLDRAFEAGDYVYIGVTTDEYIQRSQTKQLKETVQSYGERLDMLRRYLDQGSALNRAILFPLEDTAGPKALDPKLSAIVVSEETRAGGQYVNDRRAEAGVAPVETVVIQLLEDEKGVISSTRLRMEEGQMGNSGEQR